MTMRTPFGTITGLGSAKSGTEHFWMQRLTALANVPLVTFVVGFIVVHLGADRAAVVGSLHNPFVAIPMSLAIISVTWHMRLGLQVVIEDYVHGHAAKLLSLVLNTFYSTALGVAGLYAILKMSFGL
jgi:succinate dehydrogenase / fumarate reductase membrane anchor subunit